MAGQSALNAPATVRFSHPLPFARVVQLDRILGYEPRDLGVRIPPRAPIFTGPSSNGKGAVLRRLKFRFDSGRIGHEPVADGDATDCLSVPCGFESRPARQI